MFREPLDKGCNFGIISFFQPQQGVYSRVEVCHFHLKDHNMILPVECKTGLQLFSTEDLIKIHEASLHILEYTGMAMPLGEKRLDDLSCFGLKVDRKTNIVRFPPHIVESAIQHAPESYILHARNPEHNLTLDGHHGYLCLDGTGLNVKDLEGESIANHQKHNCMNCRP